MLLFICAKTADNLFADNSFAIGEMIEAAGMIRDELASADGTLDGSHRLQDSIYKVTVQGIV